MNNDLENKIIGEFRQAFDKIGVNLPEFQLLWAYGNPMKRIIYNACEQFLKLSLQQAFREGEAVGRAITATKAVNDTYHKTIKLLPGSYKKGFREGRREARKEIRKLVTKVYTAETDEGFHENIDLNKAHNASIDIILTRLSDLEKEI